MLNVFRQKGLSSVVYGLVMAATIFAFVLTFRPNAQSRTAALSETCVARVRGRCVSPKDFSAAYRVVMPSKSQALSRRLNLKKVALDGLVERELLDDEARRLGISVTDREITDQLFDGFVRVSIPVENPQLAQQVLSEMYQSYARAGLVTPDVAQQHFNDRDTAIPVDFRDPKTKQFDMKVYERQVRNLSNRSTTEFREEQARELLAAKVRDLVRDPVRISEAEAWDEYERRRSTATLAYVPVKETWAARWAVDVHPGDVEAWTRDHKADFDKALDERKKDDEPKAGHVRHILVKLPYGASDDEKAAGLAKLSWAVSRVKAGEPLAEVARDVSDDPGSAARGGDLGDKTTGFVTPFRVAADALKPGEATAGAVETQFGYHYIVRDDPSRAADVAAALERSLAKTLYARSKAVDVAQAIAGRIDAAMRGGASADDAVKGVVALYAKPQKIDMLRVLPPPPEEDAGASDATAAAPVEAGASRAAKPAEKAAAPVARSFDASLDGDRPQTQTSNAVNRGGDPFPGLSPDGTGKVMAFAFGGKEGDVLDTPVRSTDGWIVVGIKQLSKATREDFDKDQATFEADLLRTKRDEAIAFYVRRLRQQAKDDIKIEEAYIQEARVDGGGGGMPDEDEEP